MSTIKSLIYNENVKQSMDKYGLNYFKFDENSGNVTDSKGTAMGTLTGVTRVIGWDGEGNSVNFNGTNQYINFDQKIIPVGQKSVRFKINIPSRPSNYSYVMGSGYYSNGVNGFSIQITPTGGLAVAWFNGTTQAYNLGVSLESVDLGYNKWHDVLFTFDGSSAKVFINNFKTPRQSIVTSIIENNPSYNLRLGATPSVAGGYFNGQIDELQIYNKALTIDDFHLNKTLILTDGKYKTYKNGWIDTPNQSPTSTTFIEEGMDTIPVFINDLTNDFEIVNWTDEVSVNKKLEIIDAIPSPQFIHTTTLSKVTSNIVNILSSDLSSTSTTSNVRYLLTDNNITWKKWNGTDFVNITINTTQDILTVGMTHSEIMAISDWSKWNSNKINIGVYLQDDDTTTSKAGSLGFVENSSKDSPTLSNVNFYILNTTAKIELDLQGLLLSGHLSDLDSTRVQYKVTLNGQPYYPASGGYTSLSPSPQNIDITFKSSEIKMNDWNTLRVDFKDYFGTEDYWQTTFVGNYSALMFMDTDGNYYSDDIGKVLQYLDFGTIVAGEVTVAHEVVIKNQYGYAVKDLQLEASRSNLPEGVDIQLSKINTPFEPEQSLLFEDGLNFEDQTSFYVRMVTDVDSVPNDTKSFNIFVKASRKGV